MIDSSTRLLLIDDDEDDAFLTADYLDDIELLNVEHTWIGNFAKGLEALVSGQYDLCLLDYRLGAASGLDMLRQARAQNSPTPVVILTGKGDQRIAVEAMKAGAVDYMVKMDLNGENLERVIRLVMERVKAERLLEGQRRRQWVFFEQSQDAIFIADAAGCIHELNPAMKSLFGLTTNSNIQEIFLSEGDYQSFGQILETHKNLDNAAYQVNNKQGEVLEVLISASSIEEDEKPMVLGMIRDISMFQLAERDLQLAEKLNMTGRLARGLAHEVRNPLTNIQLAMQHLKNELPELTDELSPFTEIIERNHKRINDLITDLLTSAMPSSVTLTPGDIQVAMEESLELVADRMALQGVKVERDFTEGLPKVGLDWEKIKMALQNLMVNAVEAMEGKENGVLTLSSGAHPDAERGIWVSISDTGIGMDEEMQKKIFEMFYSKKKTGMGLGMVVTQNIIRSHNARIKVEAEPGKGSCFSIVFPSLD